MRTMWSIKSEPSDTADVGNDSQNMRLVDEKTHTNDPVNMNTSKRRPDGICSNELMLTVAYVKNE